MPSARAPLPASPARERLLATATELFTTRGYAATSTREIVEGAGVTKPILYHHFGSKEGIFLAIVRRMEQEFDAIFAELAASRGTPLERLRAFCHLVLRSVETHVEEVRLLHALFYGPAHGTPEIALLAFPCKIEETLSALLREAMRTGEIARGDVKTATLAVQGTLSITVETHLFAHIDTLDAEGLDRLLDLIFHGLGAKAPARATKRRKDAR